MKLKVDISEYSIQWQKNKSIFLLATLSLLILMIFLFFFIKYNFYIPISIFTQSLENEVMIDNPDILNKNDEFGVLSKKYNLLYLNLQNQIKHNQALLNENKQFITDMVHQIRTPLTVIMTNTSLIEMKTKEKVSTNISQINSAINMLSNSYEDLSYIISNDTIEYKPIKINLTNFLHHRVDFFEPIAQANGKKINSNIANEINISMNDVELERLIDNNLSNAIKHSYNDTEIEVLLEKNHSEILLKFISKGQKIHNNSKIFNKGYTESYGAKRSLGLGLDMVKMICEKNNITYSVYSEDSNNTFTYTFKV
jgi:signal transduction histidine kinase